MTALCFSYSAAPVDDEVKKESRDLSVMDTADVDDYDLDDDVQDVRLQ